MRESIRVAKNITHLSLANIVPRFLTVLLTFVAARKLGQVGFGEFNTALAFVGIFGVLTDLGINTLTVREIARDREGVARYVSDSFFLKCLLALLYAGAMAAGVSVLGYGDPLRTAILLLGLAWILDSLASPFGAVFQAYERMEYTFFLSASSAAVRFGLGLMALLLGYGILGLAAAFLMVNLLQLAFTVLWSRRAIAPIPLSWSRSSLASFFRMALPFGISYLFIVVYFKVDVLMLAQMKGAAAVGLYSAAYRLIEILQTVPGVFMGALFPVFSRHAASSRDSLHLLYEKTLKYLALISLPLAVGILVWAREIILLFYGDAYLGAVPALQILIWTILFLFANAVFGTVLTALERMSLLCWVMGVNTVLNILLNLWFIPEAGLNLSYLGAALATLICEAASCLFLFVYLSRTFYRPRFIRSLLPALGACSFMSLFLYFLRPWPWIPLAVTAGILYLAALWIFRAFDELDRSFIREMLLRTRGSLGMGKT